MLRPLVLAVLFGSAPALTLTSFLAAAPGAGPTASYFWASGRGAVGGYSTSRSRAPRELSDATLAWTWHDPKGRYYDSPVAANIDDRRNIYLTSLNGIRKFSPDGALVWTWRKAPREELPDTASIYDGAVYCSTTAGRIFALSMETGKELWVTKLPSTDANNGWVNVHEGVVITGSDARGEYKGKPRPGQVADQLVTGLNASDGGILWNFKPQAPVWNFAATFAGDGTFAFQDYEARAYRCRLKDGRPLWISGGVDGSWTDGSALLGPNGVLYTVGNYGGGARDHPGVVSAYNYEDGSMLWAKDVPQPPNNMPAIGRLAGQKGLSLVQPIGQQCAAGNPTAVYALDAETGEVQWVFDGPRQKHSLQAGDDNPFAALQRVTAGVRPITLPNPWSAPSIDAEGTVFIGSQEGPIFSLRDTNGDGTVNGKEEVSSYNTAACFSGSSSPAIADGLLAVASIDALYVFKG